MTINPKPEISERKVQQQQLDSLVHTLATDACVSVCGYVGIAMFVSMCTHRYTHAFVCMHLAVNQEKTNPRRESFGQGQTLSQESGVL